MAPEHIDQLFAKTLMGDYEDETRWQAVRELRRIATREVFDKAAVWCRSEEPLARARGLDVLAQIAKTVDHPNNSFPDESFSVVSSVLRNEQEIRPLDSAIAALGHLDNPLGIPLIIQHKLHPDANIRFAVACALESFPNDHRSAQCLLLLMREDGDEDVRDWATFSLGVQGDLDSDQIRDALLERLADSNQDVRDEAMASLGKRQEPRVLPSLVSALARPTVSRPVIQAARDMLDLEADREDWGTDNYAAALRERYGQQFLR
jgi:HEAT repeat protein